MVHIWLTKRCYPKILIHYSWTGYHVTPCQLHHSALEWMNMACAIKPGATSPNKERLGVHNLDTKTTNRHSALGTPSCPRGRFRTARAQRGHSAGTAPIITVIIQVTTLKTTHLRNHAQSIQNSKFKHLMLAMGPRDLNSAPYSPVHCSSHSMTSFQSSELTELPVVENSQLFAQRAHSARYAPLRAPCARPAH